MSITDTDRKALDGIVAALQQRGPDWAYPQMEFDDEGDAIMDPNWFADHGGTCIYVQADGSPACIIGVAFAAENLPLPEHGTNDNWENVDTLIRKKNIGVTPKTQTFLSDVQSEQDVNHTWGDAVSAAVPALGTDERAYLLVALRSAGIAIAAHKL